MRSFTCLSPIIPGYLSLIYLKLLPNSTWAFLYFFSPFLLQFGHQQHSFRFHCSSVFWGREINFSSRSIRWKSIGNWNLVCVFGGIKAKEHVKHGFLVLMTKLGIQAGNSNRKCFMWDQMNSTLFHSLSHSPCVGSKDSWINQGCIILVHHEKSSTRWLGKHIHVKLHCACSL